MNTGMTILLFAVVLIAVVSGVVIFNAALNKPKELEVEPWLNEVQDKEALLEKFSAQKQEGAELISMQIQRLGIDISQEEAKGLAEEYERMIRAGGVKEASLPQGTHLISIGGKSRETGELEIAPSSDELKDVVLKTGRAEDAFLHSFKFKGYELVFATLKNYGNLGLKEIAPSLLLKVEAVPSTPLQLPPGKYPTLEAWAAAGLRNRQEELRHYQCSKWTQNGWQAVECPVNP